MVQLVAPSRGHVTQWFGNVQPDGLPHAGQDYAYTDGVNIFPEVFAAADGVVQFAGDSRTLPWPNAWYVNNDFNRADKQDSSAGNLITIRHDFGADTGYAHLERCFVKAGDTVKAGQQIGIAGNTGYSFGRHLHFFLMFHPFNYNTSTYGCSDPNPYFGGLAAMGTIAPEENDVLTIEDKEWLGNKLFEVLQDKNVLERQRAAIINDTSLRNIQGTLLPTLNAHAQALWDGIQAVPGLVVTPELEASFSRLKQEIANIKVTVSLEGKP